MEKNVFSKFNSSRKQSDLNLLSKRISASLTNSPQNQRLTVSTEGKEKLVTIPDKADGKGSSVNGGELLFLALATCFCNDTYREAAKPEMAVEFISVTVTGSLARKVRRNITYGVKVVDPDHPDREIQGLFRHVDTLVEIHNTLRQGTSVVLK